MCLDRLTKVSDCHTYVIASGPVVDCLMTLLPPEEELTGSLCVCVCVCVCVRDELMRCRGLLQGTSLMHDQEQTRRSSIDNGAICVETVM